MKKCPKCGATAGDAAVICYECLYSFQLMSCIAMEPEAIAEEPAEELAEIAPPEPIDMSRLAIAVKNDEFGTRRFSLERGSLFLGRLPTNEIVVNDRTVSRRHLHIFVEQNNVYVEDLESTNRTLLNGTLLKEKAAIKPGDVVQARSVTLWLEDTAEAEGAEGLIGA